MNTDNVLYIYMYMHMPCQQRCTVADTIHMNADCDRI